MSGSQSASHSHACVGMTTIILILKKLNPSPDENKDRVFQLPSGERRLVTERVKQTII